MAAITAGAGRWEVVKKGRRPGAGGGGGGRGGGADRRTLGEANGVWKYDLTREYPPAPPPPGPELAPPGATEQLTSPGSSRREPSCRSAPRVPRAPPLPCVLSLTHHMAAGVREVAALASQMRTRRPGGVRCPESPVRGTGTRVCTPGSPHTPEQLLPAQPGRSGRVSGSWEGACSLMI